MIFDPLYWIIIGIGLVLSLWASASVKSTFARYGDVTTRRRLTGAQVAESILRDCGIHDVQVAPVHGSLTDHYDPSTKTLRLSEPVYDSASVAALGVAAHEVGHAIQHAAGYRPLKFRSAWVPLANFGGGISIFLLVVAAMLGGIETVSGQNLSIIGLTAFAMTTVFTLITLPVEFDASRRALTILERGRYLTAEELGGARRVLNAAAMTYVAAFVTSLLTLLYWMFRLGLLGGRRQG